MSGSSSATLLERDRPGRFSHASRPCKERLTAFILRNPPSSILSQLHSSTLPSQYNPVSNLDPSLESPRAPTPPQPSEEPEYSTALWTHSVPYGKSPPHANGASITGPSPQNHSSPDGLKGGFNRTSPQTSPRSAFRQPTYRNNEYQSFGGYLGASPPSRRPHSVHSNQSNLPPPPHHPQAHYYGAPDLDFGTHKSSTKERYPGEHHCSVFDKLPLSGSEGPAKTENVLLVGNEHGVDVYHIDKKRLNRIGCLNGLRGSVIGAKILPGFVEGRQPSETQTLIAVIIHGPGLPPDADHGQNPNVADHDEFDASGSMLQALQHQDVNYFQTTVEVYSLPNGSLVTTLYKSPKIEVQATAYGTKPIVPGPAGCLSIQATGRFIIVSSGTSGEVFIYERLPARDDEVAVNVRCLGKVWTKVSSKKARSHSVSSRDSGAMQDDDQSDDVSKLPLVSLSSRWLALSPPSPSSQSSIHGQIPEELGTKILGASSHAPPTEPPITCPLDTPEGESFFNKIARDAAQELAKGALWVGSQGMQAWNNYWSKPPDHTQQTFAGSPPRAAQMMAPQEFPPTHAQENPANRSRNQPALVSILDLERLSQSQNVKEAVALQPLATFSVPGGCSILSFAPSGLQLLTANARGDVQQVWDLMRAIHVETEKASGPDVPSKGPNVREVARFTRITEARIIDVVWTKPRGERLGMITDHGTVHIYDLPPSAFYWPPLRRDRRVVSAPHKFSHAEGLDHERGKSEPTANALSSAFGIISGKTQPLLSAVRGRTTSASGVFSGFGGFASTAGGGGKAVASGINRSFTAAASGTVNTIRHLGENRISLPGSAKSILPGCIQWLGGTDETLLAVTASGLVRIHNIRQSNNPKAGRRRPSAVGGRPAEFAIPHEHEDHGRSRSGEPTSLHDSFWLPPVPRPSSRGAIINTHPLSQAEIETHAPYQPFHTDRRVHFFVYNHATEEADPHHLVDIEPWTFGEAIQATKISSGTATHDEDDPDMNEAGPGRMENTIRVEGNEEDGRQIVVTTRRNRHVRDDQPAVDDDGEFFEEDLAVVDFAEDRV